MAEVDKRFGDYTGGHKEMSSILADQSAPYVVYEPKCGGRGVCGV
jgi:hypothetical protein